MKKLIVLLLCLSLTLLAACGDREEPATESAVIETTEETTEAPAETTEVPTETEEPGPLETVSVSAGLHHDSVGNVWLQFIGAYRNCGEEPLQLDYMDVTVSAAGAEEIALTSVEPYPQVIAPGETGYYYEMKRVDLGDAAELSADPEVSWTPAEEPVRYKAEELTVRDTPYGLEAAGTLEKSALQEENMICVAAVLLDEESGPLAVLFDYFTPEDLANGFVLSGSQLPEELHAADVSKCLLFAYPYEV